MKSGGGNIKDVLFVLMAWLMAMGIVYLVYLKVKILFN
jgi:hypothetical protein